MGRIACIVEGHGDVASVPVMVRRIATEIDCQTVEVLRPIRVKRTQVVRPGELERAVELGAGKLGHVGGILVLLDADQDPPCQLGPSLLERIRSRQANLLATVVLAQSEKEAWFIASIESLRGKRGIPPTACAPENPEEIRGAKEWLGRLRGYPYRETIDQPAFAASFDMTLAALRSASFARFRREVEALLRGISENS
ncbi:MAG: DUF4276 family protein [Planctomycetota bacterium]